MKHFNPLFLLASVLFIAGCAQVPLEITRFDLQLDRPDVKTVVIDKETYAQMESPDYKVEAALYEYETVMVASLIIENRTYADLLPNEYSVSLADGRDMKPIKMLTRDDLINFRSKYSGSSSAKIQDQLIESTMTLIMNRINLPTKDKLIDIINQGIDQYFAFRPVYANDKRKGVVCFVSDFELEYPIDLSVKIKENVFRFKFMPVKQK